MLAFQKEILNDPKKAPLVLIDLARGKCFQVIVVSLLFVHCDMSLSKTAGSAVMYMQHRQEAYRLPWLQYATIGQRVHNLLAKIEHASNWIHLMPRKTFQHDLRILLAHLPFDLDTVCPI